MWNPKYFSNFNEKYNPKDARSTMNTKHKEYEGNKTHCNQIVKKKKRKS